MPGKAHRRGRRCNGRCACSPPTRRRGWRWANTTCRRTIPQEALNELRAAVYLNPETSPPNRVIDEDPELLEVRNAYLLALRETGAK